MRILPIAAAAVAVAGGATGALAQTVKVVPESNVEVVRPAPATTNAPTTTATTAPVPRGEARVVTNDQLVRLDDDFVIPRLNVPVYQLDDYDLVDVDGRDLGEVEAVLGPNENTATAAAVEFDGPGWSLFGIGSDDVTRVVDISEFSIQGDKLVLDIKENQAREFPVYQD